MRCTYKTISKVRLCPSDLTHFVTVSRRSIVGDHPLDLEQINTTIEPVLSLYMACETVSPYKPVTAVNTGDKITHVFYARFGDVSIGIDIKEHVIKIGDVIYRIDSVENLNNLNETLAIYCFVSGSGIEASA